MAHLLLFLRRRSDGAGAENDCSVPQHADRDSIQRRERPQRHRFEKLEALSGAPETKGESFSVNYMFTRITTLT
jgi:hypothetical protein